MPLASTLGYMSEVVPFDAEEFKKERVEKLNDMYRDLTRLYTVKSDMAMYVLAKNGWAKMKHIAQAFSVKPPVVYKVVEKFEKEFGDRMKTTEE